MFSPEPLTPLRSSRIPVFSPSIFDLDFYRPLTKAMFYLSFSEFPFPYYNNDNAVLPSAL